MSETKPEIFAIQRGRSGWRLSRRDLAAAAAAASAAAMPGCGKKEEPAVVCAPPSQVVPGAQAGCSFVYAHTQSVRALAFSRDGGLLVSGGEDKKVKLWSLPGGAVIKTLEGEADQFAAGVDGRLLVAARDKPAEWWSLPEGTRLQAIEGRADGVLSMAVSPDGRLLASGAQDGTIHLWSLAESKLLCTLRERTRTVDGIKFPPGGITAIAVCLDGHRLAAVSGEHTIGLWSPKDREVIRTMEGRGKISAIAMSPDGRLLASAGSHDTLTLWSLDDGCELKFFSRVMESDTVRALAISADGRLLASGGDDRAIRLWSLSEGTHKACLMDLAANRPTTKGVQYRSRGDGGQMASYTLPCGSPIPAGAVCTCNCVPGSACSCVGHSNRSCSCVPVHYWHPN